jgi:hypothetical protein
MMVVPQQPVVRLRFGALRTDWMGILATLAGIGLCFAMPRRPRERPRLPPVAVTSVPSRDARPDRSRWR